MVPNKSRMRGWGCKSSILGITLSLLMAELGCGGGGTTTTTNSQVVAVSIINPSTSQTVPVNGTLGIVAVVSGTSNTGVTWAVGGITNGNSTFGKITDSGLSVNYTAPTAVPNPATFSITATSTADNTKSASVSVTITAVVAVGISITSPANPASVTVGETIPITASVTESGNTAVTWTVTGTLAGSVTNGNSTVGTIPGVSPSSTYTAPPALPTGNNPVTITATSQADSTKSASVTVTINPSSTNPNAINVPGNVDATGVNLNLSAITPTLGLADVGIFPSAGVASVTITKGSTLTLWLLGQGLTNRAGSALASGLTVSVSQGSTSDVTVSSVTPLSPTNNAAALTNITFSLHVSASATSGPRNIIVTNGAGELQAFIGGIQIQ